MARIVEMHGDGFVPAGTEHLLVRAGKSGHFEVWAALDGDDELFRAVETAFASQPEALSAAGSLAFSMGVATIYVEKPGGS